METRIQRPSRLPSVQYSARVTFPSESSSRRITRPARSWTMSCNFAAIWTTTRSSPSLSRLTSWTYWMRGSARISVTLCHPLRRKSASRRFHSTNRSWPRSVWRRREVASVPGGDDLAVEPHRRGLDRLGGEGGVVHGRLLGRDFDRAGPSRPMEPDLEQAHSPVGPAEQGRRHEDEPEEHQKAQEACPAGAASAVPSAPATEATPPPPPPPPPPPNPPVPPPGAANNASGDRQRRRAQTHRASVAPSESGRVIRGCRDRRRSACLAPRSAAWRCASDGTRRS